MIWSKNIVYLKLKPRTGDHDFVIVRASEHKAFQPIMLQKFIIDMNDTKNLLSIINIHNTKVPVDRETYSLFAIF